MNVYTITGFHGHWPVGTAAVVVARDRDQAVLLLNDRLETLGLKQDAGKANIELVSLDAPAVLVLCDGDY